MNKTGINNSNLRHGRPDNFCMVAKETDPTLWNVNFNRPIVVQRKLNGVRAILIYGEDGLKGAFHRTGLPIKNIELISKVSGISSTGEPYIGRVVLDCEIYAHDINFDDIRSATQSSFKSFPPNTQCHIFDAIIINEWVNKSTSTYENRLRSINFIEECCFPYNNFFAKVESFKVSNKSRLLELYDRFLNEGYEGLMIKYLDEPYHWGKTDAILKLKPGR